MSLLTCSLRAVRVVRERLLEPRAHAQDLGGLDLDVGRLAAARLADRGLVDEDARVRQREALARRARRGSTAAAEAAWPSTTVWICGRMYCIVS